MDLVGWLMGVHRYLELLINTLDITCMDMMTEPVLVRDKILTFVEEESGPLIQTARA